MTSKDLVTEAIEFNDVPRVPYCVSFTERARDAFLDDSQGHTLYDRLDNDIISTPIIRIEYGVRDATGHYTDEFGVVWDRSADPDIGIPVPSLTPENLSRFHWPAPDAAGRFDGLVENVNNSPDKFHLMAFDFSLFERAWSLRGLENMLMDFVTDEDFVEALLDRIVQFNIDTFHAGLDACSDFDGAYFGDDFGTQRGMMMGAQRWRKLIKPRLARQYGAVKAAGKKVFIHSCGCVQEVFDDLVEIGVDVFNPFQPEVMDVYDYHRRYHGKLAFWGGVSTQKLLPYGTVTDVRNEVAKLLEMGRKGGYIIAPAHAIPGDAKVANIAAMLEMLYDQPH